MLLSEKLTSIRVHKHAKHVVSCTALNWMLDALAEIDLVMLLRLPFIAVGMVWIG